MSGDVTWVTGANGFIGRHLVRRLVEQEIPVIGFGRTLHALPSSGLAAYFPGALSTSVLEQAAAEYGPPAAVYHLAGGTTVGASVADPLGDYNSSVATTARLFDCLHRVAPGAHVVLASSAAVYGAGHDGSINIDENLTPFSPYGHHKLMAEHICQAYAESFGLRTTILRLFSVYGHGISKQLIFDLCTRLAAGQNPIVLGGTGRERRDWCHVTDVVSLFRSLKPGDTGPLRVCNVAAGQPVTISEVANLVATAWGSNIKVTFTGRSRPGDPFSLVADPASLPAEFVETVNLEKGLKDFVENFRMGVS